MAVAAGCASMAVAQSNVDAVARGAEVFVSRSAGHCVLCHTHDALDAPFQGNLGPDLSDVGARSGRDALRERIVDPRRFNPESIMPAYRRTHGFHAVDPAFDGRAILSAAEVDQLVAFLAACHSRRSCGVAP